MDLSKIRQRLKETKVYSYSLDEFMGILASILIIPLMSIQMIKTYKRGRANDFALMFLLLQILGTPQGGGGLITGIVKKNWQIASIVVLSLLVALLLRRDKKVVGESLKIAQESYKNQLDALDESYEKEAERRAEADENYKNTIEKIEKETL